MKISMLVPWVCVLGLTAGLAALYSTSQKKDAELAALREESHQLEQVRNELEETKKSQTQSEQELARLRKDQEELLRLRNQVQLLRNDKQQLTRQAQSAQAQAQDAQAQAQALRANGVPAPAPDAAALQQQAAMQAFRARYGLTGATNQLDAVLVCVNNLRLIDGAKQQWALENNKPSGALMTVADLAPYLKTNSLPACPAGGIYTLNPVGISPICSINGHTISK